MLSNIWTHRKGTSTARASDGRRRETRERSVSLARHSSDISRGGARVKRNQRECGKGGRAGGAEYSGLRVSRRAHQCETVGRKNTWPKARRRTQKNSQGWGNGMEAQEGVTKGRRITRTYPAVGFSPPRDHPRLAAGPGAASQASGESPQRGMTRV
jgi:hypothetical protein